MFSSMQLGGEGDFLMSWWKYLCPLPSGPFHQSSALRCCFQHAVHLNPDFTGSHSWWPQLTCACISYISEWPTVMMNSNLTSSYFYAYLIITQKLSTFIIYLLWIRHRFDGKVLICWQRMWKSKNSHLQEMNPRSCMRKICSQNLVPKPLNNEITASVQVKNVYTWLWYIETSVHYFVILFSSWNVICV